MNSALASKVETAAAPKQRQKLQVDPARISRGFDGHVRRHYVVHLPEGLIADDLKEGSLWTRVQRGPNPLRRHDAVFMMSHDQSWSADGIASEPWSTGATLAGIRIIQTPQRVSPLFRDELYAVVHSGHGLHHVERLVDGHKMSKSVASANIAGKGLRNLYPQRIGAA